MLCAFFEVRTEGFALMNFSRPFAPPKDNYCSLDPIDFVLFCTGTIPQRIFAQSLHSFFVNPRIGTGNINLATY